MPVGEAGVAALQVRKEFLEIRTRLGMGSWSATGAGWGRLLDAVVQEMSVSGQREGTCTVGGASFVPVHSGDGPRENLWRLLLVYIVVDAADLVVGGKPAAHPARTGLQLVVRGAHRPM